MARASRERFLALVGRLGACSARRRWHLGLIEAHGRPPRAYHHLGHLEACLDALEELRDEADHPDRVELALWFHDAIYDPRRADNEARSAALAHRALSEMGIGLTTGRAVERLILVTAHRREPESADERVILDADLSILGAGPEAYGRYEGAIRKEYAHVPDDAFRAGRAALLARFLERERLFHTSLFFERHEALARQNLRQAQEALDDNPR